MYHIAMHSLCMYGQMLLRVISSLRFVFAAAPKQQGSLKAFYKGSYKHTGRILLYEHLLSFLGCIKIKFNKGFLRKLQGLTKGLYMKLYDRMFCKMLWTALKLCCVLIECLGGGGGGGLYKDCFGFCRVLSHFRGVDGSSAKVHRL